MLSMTDPATASEVMPAMAVPAGAPFLRRVLALLIDLMAINLLAGSGLALLGGDFALLARAGWVHLLIASGTFLGACWLLPPLLALAYFVIFAACGGQTIGKLVCRLQVIDTAGGPLPWGRAFLRAVGLLLSALPLGAGFLWALVDPERRAWHDHLALTRVVAVEKSLDNEAAFQ